eukprot:scaffold46608_cov33-Tisochrysis_lutea.AAC.1
MPKAGDAAALQQYDPGECSAELVRRSAGGGRTRANALMPCLVLTVSREPEQPAAALNAPGVYAHGSASSSARGSSSHRRRLCFLQMANNKLQSADDLRHLIMCPSITVLDLQVCSAIRRTRPLWPNA